jgi:hypothetical protein
VVPNFIRKLARQHHEMEAGFYAAGMPAKRKIILDGAHAPVSTILGFLAYSIKVLLHSLDESFGRDWISDFKAS